MQVRHHVIIGNSAAGLNAARAIRESDRAAAITMLTNEACPAYSPVVLPYLVSGRIREEQMVIADAAFYRRHRITLRQATPAEGLDTDRRRVHLPHGERLDYDRLLIATGAAARRLTVDAGTAGDKVFTLRTMADAKAIGAAARSATGVLMIGAGLVGLETGYALARQGKRVTILAKSDHLLSRNTDEPCARLIQERIERHGIRFLFGREVTGLARANGRIRVATDRGDDLCVDLIVVGKGVVPNLGIVEGTSIAVDRGIRVDPAMRTNLPGVFAAGDVAEARHLLSGRPEMFGNWPSACLEGRTAGINMAGGTYNLAGEVACNMLPVFERTAAFLESPHPADDRTRVFTRVDARRAIYRKVLVRNDRIIGAVLLGACRDAGVLHYLLRKRRDVARIADTLADRPVQWGRVARNERRRAV